jgi:hypothetical protein
MEQTSRGGLRQHISRKHREEHRLAKEKAKIAQVGDLADGVPSLVVIGPAVTEPFPFQWTFCLIDFIVRNFYVRDLVFAVNPVPYCYTNIIGFIIMVWTLNVVLKYFLMY